MSNLSAETAARRDWMGLLARAKPDELEPVMAELVERTADYLDTLR